MADPYIREVGRVEGLEGSDIVVGVNYDSVVIDYGAPLNSAKAEEFARLFTAACWEAGENKRCLREEVHEADGGDSMEACDAVGIKDGTGYECTELGPHRVHLARAADPEHGEIVHAWDAR